MIRTPNNAKGKERAKQGLAQLFGSLIKANDREAILTLEEEGVDLIHGLNAAVRNGAHPWVAYFLERKAKPTAETLIFAIDRGQKTIDAILPHVKPSQGHVIEACIARRPELIEHLVISMHVPVPKMAFEALVTKDPYDNPSGRKEQEKEQKIKECIPVLLRAPSISKLPALSFQFAMPFVSAKQIAALVKRCGPKIDTNRLYEQAVRSGNSTVSAYLANYAPLTKSVLIRASLPESRTHSRPSRITRYGASTSFTLQVGRVLDECVARRLPEIDSAIARRWSKRIIERIYDQAYYAHQFNDPQRKNQSIAEIDLAKTMLARIVAFVAPKERDGLIADMVRHCTVIEKKERDKAAALYPNAGARSRLSAQIDYANAAMWMAVKDANRSPQVNQAAEKHFEADDALSIGGP